jgi:excisionase family DNA binding protein
MSNQLHLPEPQRPVLTADEAADLLGISVRHLWACLASGRLGPQPIAFGRAKRWRKEELLAWIAAGAPPRDQWLARESNPDFQHGGRHG